MEKESRKRKRVNFTTLVTLISHDRVLKDLNSRDLSLKGLYVETSERLPVGAKVDIKLELAGTTSLVALKMKGVVVRSDGNGLGLDFIEVDLDSFFHLRNIIRYNADDPSEVDNEMAKKPAF